MTIIEYKSSTIKKSTGVYTSEKRLYVSSLPADTPTPGAIVRNHWSIESMHWGPDVNLLQGKVKRKSAKAPRNLDTIQRIVCTIFPAWKGRRKKKADKKKGSLWPYMLSVRSVMLPVSLSPYFFQCIVYQYGYRKVCNKINDMEQEYIVPFVDFCLIIIVHYLFASTIMLIIKVYEYQY